MQLFERLKSERERLGYSQTAFAELVGATRKTLFNWETGTGSPTADALEAWSTTGIDVLWIVTGKHGSGGMDALPADERVLLNSYRACTPDAKANLIQTAALLSAGLGNVGGLAGGGSGGGRVGGTYSQHATGAGSIQLGARVKR